MFDIKHTVTAADWVDGKGLLVATETAFKDKFELMELHLPDKITDNENSLKKGCDFHVRSGGFSAIMIDCLRHIPRTRRCLVSTSDTSAIQLWELGNDTTNLIQPLQDKSVCPSLHSTGDSIAGSSKISNVCGQSVAFGASSDLVVIADVEMCKNVQEIVLPDKPGDQTHRISDLYMIDCSTLLCCTSSGNLFKYDTRSPQTAVCAWQSRNSNTLWRMANADSGNLVMLASTEYDVFCVSAGDFENWMQIDICDSEQILKNIHMAKQFCIQCRGDGKQFSLSGFNGNVYVYKVPKSQGSRTCQSVKTEFVHDGHMMNSSSQSEDISVVKHMWLPGKQIVVSMATDGSLHAWQHRPHSK
ncbi:WD repeat-containing protein 73-like isoform X2 [Dreissena polymorpha]|nr:WD repeat-containing protein 73-like isoform X2 [Dreissena polymorpha]